MSALAVGLLAATPVAPASADPDAPVDSSRPVDTQKRRLAPTLTITERSLGGGTIEPDLIGANQRWLRNADGAWDAQRNRLRKETARLVRKIGLGTIRYPGGTVANIFDFRNAMGTPGCQVSGGLLRPTFKAIPAGSSEYTIGRHARFIKSAGARTNLMIPMINQTPQDAVDYVKAVSAATGQKQFYVEVGNEPYLSWQRYWRSKDKRKRLDQYILGGVAPISDRGLYPTSGCNLADRVRADGSADQTYRTRYWPISTSTPPVVTVNGVQWEYATQLGGLFGGRRFTLSADRKRVVFGSGLLNLAAPRGDIRIRYSAGELPGFVDFYRALKNIPGIDVDVCTAWAGDLFVRRMDQLGEDYDCMAVHSYASFGGSRGGASEFRSSVASAKRQLVRISELRALIRGSSHPGARDRYLTVTEFGGEHRAHSGPRDGAFLRELVQAISLVGQINEGVRLSNVSNFQGLIEQFDKRVALSGRAYLLGMVRRLVGQEAVQVTGRKPNLVLAATRDGQRASLLAVNTSWNKARKIRLQLDGRRGGTCVAARTLATDPFTVTRAPSPRARPRSVRPATRALWAKKADFFTHKMAPHSITLLTFSKRTPGRACPLVYPL